MAPETKYDSVIIDKRKQSKIKKSITLKKYLDQPNIFWFYYDQIISHRIFRIIKKIKRKMILKLGMIV